ncbi:MAG: DUF456 family protein [Calditrichia bacterium]
MDVVELIFVAILGFSIIANFFSIPGNFIIVFNAFWYGLVTGFDRFSFSFMLTLLIIAIGVELLEYIIIAFGARRYGATKLGTVAGILGGIAGSISGFFVSPVLGAIIGGFIGVILGTSLIEITRGRTLNEALNATYGALLGRLGGLTVKALGSLTMVVIVAMKILN